MEADNVSSKAETTVNVFITLAIHCCANIFILYNVDHMYLLSPLYAYSCPETAIG